MCIYIYVYRYLALLGPGPGFKGLIGNLYGNLYGIYIYIYIYIHILIYAISIAILIPILEFVFGCSSFVVCQAVSIEILVKNDIINLKSAFLAKNDIL